MNQPNSTPEYIVEESQEIPPTVSGQHRLDTILVEAELHQFCAACNTAILTLEEIRGLAQGLERSLRERL